MAPAEFERFVVEEWAPAFQDLYPGIEVQVLKGERGGAPGTYVLVFDITSLRVRNHYFPTPGGQSEAAQSLWKECGERCERAQRRFAELVSVTGYSDYYALVRK